MVTLIGTEGDMVDKPTGITSEKLSVSVTMEMIEVERESGVI